MTHEVVAFPARALDAEPLAPLLHHLEQADLDTRQTVLTAGCASLAMGLARMVDDDLVVSFSAYPDPAYRTGVGVCLLDDDGRVLLEQRPDQAVVAWQLPQGQLREGEAPLGAVQRLLRRGGVEDIDPISQSYGWLRYEFPAAVADRLWRGAWRGQQQKWLLARVRGEGRTASGSRPRAGGSHWRWAALDELAFLIRPLTRIPLETMVTVFG